MPQLSPAIDLRVEKDVEEPQSRPRLLRSITEETRHATTAAPLKNTILRSHGRPPWYDENGNHVSDAFLIGISGGSASGKTHVARQIVRSLGSIPTVVIISQDSFYKELTPEQLELAFANKYDLDHPDALDMPLFAKCISDLKKGHQTNIPVYSFSEHQRLKEKKYLYGASIIIAEGIMTLHDPTLRASYDLKIFVKADSDLMLARRIARDIKERGRDVEGVLAQYLRFVKPAYDNFVLPSSRHADIIVHGSDNSVAIELITTHIRRQLEERSRSFREKMARSRSSEHCLIVPPSEDLAALKLHLVEQTPQLKGIYTILRDKTTSREDFIFFTDRLSTFLMEQAMVYLPFAPTTITTPTGAKAEGKKLSASDVCGVTILRSGGPLESGLRRVISDIRVGSLLVQSDVKTGEPLLLHVMLPCCIRDRERAKEAYVFLLDAQISTGATAFMSIRVLLDHGVQQSRIIFVTFLVARGGGIAALRHAFPDIKIVCGAADGELQERWVEAAYQADSLEASEKDTEGRKIWIIHPGLGHIGDRYYC